MTVKRQRFAIDTDTGVQTLTGPNFFGGVLQLGWNPETVDTGDNLDVFLCPTDGDTEGGFPIFSKEGLSASFLNPLVASGVHKNATDTGTSGAQSVYAAAGDHLVVKATPSGAALKGEFYAWTYTG